MMIGPWLVVSAGITAAVAAAFSLLAGQDSGGQVGLSNGTKMLPEADSVSGSQPDDMGPGPSERWAEAFGDLLGRTVRAVGTQGAVFRERVAGFYGAYRLLRALGMSDAEIAVFIAGQARARLERRLEGRALTAADLRHVLDGVEETVVRAAEEVDERLNLGGDFVRRVREGAQAARTGREDALIAVERALAAGREQLGRLLREQGTKG